MDQAKRQEIADKVIAHLRAQKKAARSGAVCMYRTDDGRKCAVGALIPDSLYTPAIEGTMVSCINDADREHGNYDALRAVFDSPAMGMDRNDQELLSLLGALQSFHDSRSNWTVDGIREEKVRPFMHRIGLEYRPPTE